ncbi:BRO family protein [Tsuneonella sp. YG55]|uniref:BRO family protein n=1 Tax=Tsuneonella litorea TaxID=2976475 RepID=A0A9X2VZU9_9SPHN|nr:BRO family protein [Tsuneonella litorea]MCT2558417.1 BRO family protein [Tsuneonella litorea]
MGLHDIGVAAHCSDPFATENRRDFREMELTRTLGGVPLLVRRGPASTCRAELTRTIGGSSISSAERHDTFTFAGQQLRTIDIDGTPWFCGGDVLTILLGSASGKGSAYDKLFPRDVRKVDRIALGMKPGRPVNVVNESGLYKLIMRSDKPEARAFQDWVTREVLPAIRRTGGK